MTTARIINTRKIVSASDLFELYPNYRELEFVCMDEKCSVRMAPACISRQDHRKKPHFKKYRNQEHTETCEYATLSELYNTGINQKLNEIQVNKIGYPSVFILYDDDSEAEQKISQARLDDLDEGVTGRGGTTKIYEFDDENIKFDRRNRVQGIDRIVDWYLGFPYNRDVEIEVHSNKIQYRFFFKKIDWNTDPLTLNNERIFYGRLMLSDANKNVFDKYSDNVFLKLLGFKPKNEVSNRTHNNYSIKIDKNSISKMVLSRLKNKYNLLFENALTDLKNGSAEPNVGLYVFVYGKIDDEHDTLINTIKHYITFRYDEVRKTMIE